MGEQRCFFARCFGAPVAGRDLAQGDPGRLALGTLLEEALQFLEPLMAAQASLPPLPVPPPQAWAPAAKACYLPALRPGLDGANLSSRFLSGARPPEAKGRGTASALSRIIFLYVATYNGLILVSIKGSKPLT